MPFEDSLLAFKRKVDTLGDVKLDYDNIRKLHGEFKKVYDENLNDYLGGNKKKHE